MRYALGFTLVLAAVSPARLAAQDGATAARHNVEPRTWVGERLEYDVKFGIFTLGRAALEVTSVDTIRGEEALHIEFLLDGGNFLYRLHNEWDSWVGLEDFASRRFVQDHDEGGKKYRNAYEIYPDSGFYRQEGVDSLLPTVERPLDDAAFFYYVRLVELEPGRRYELPHYFKPDRNPIVLEVVRRDTIDLPAGRFATLVVRPVIKGGGIFKEGAEGHMWITDDPRRLVVQIKSKFIGIGSITMRLTKLVEAGAPRDSEATR